MQMKIPLPNFQQRKPAPDKPTAHFTGSMQFFYQEPTGSPTVAEATFGRKMPLAGEPEPYTTTLNETWVPLKPRELASVSFFFIKNREGEGLQVMPTPEEVQAISERVIEIRFGDGDPACQVPPQEGYPFNLVDWTTVRIRCRKGMAKVSIVLYP